KGRLQVRFLLGPPLLGRKPIWLYRPPRFFLTPQTFPPDVIPDILRRIGGLACVHLFSGSQPCHVKNKAGGRPAPGGSGQQGGRSQWWRKRIALMERSLA